MPTLTDSDRRAYEMNIWKMYAFQLTGSFQLWWPIWVIYLTDYRGFSLTQVSGLEALFWIVVVLAEVPTGVVADRFGRKTSLVLGAVSVTIAVLVFGQASSYGIVLASYVAWGFALTFQSGADSALMFESLRAVGRERDYPRVAGVGFGIFSLGTLAGLLIGAPLAAATNLAFPVQISAAISFLGLLISLTYREPPTVVGEERLPYRQLLRDSTRTAWRLPSVRTMLLLSAVLIGGTNALMIFSQPFLDHHDVAVDLFGLVQSPMRVAGIAGSVLAYRIVSRFGLRWTMIVMPIVMVGSYLTLGLWDNVYAFGATTPIVLASSMLLPIVSGYINERIPNNQRATILSFRQLLTSVLVAALQVSLGVIADTISLEMVFIVSGVFVAIAVPPALLLWLRADTQEERTNVGLAEAAAGS